MSVAVAESRRESPPDLLGLVGTSHSPTGSRTTHGLGLEGSADDPERLADELAREGVRVTLVPGDLDDPEVPARVVAQAAEVLGPLDALVMSHTESVDSGVLDTTVESFDRHYAVNIRATWLLIATFARQLPSTGGSVIALTSDHTVGNLPYGVTKGGLDRLVLASAHELAGRGLRANVINPGPIDTGWMDAEIRAACIAQQPTRRIGTPRDIANLVTFLLSEEGSWTNGQLLYCNGGFPAGRIPV